MNCERAQRMVDAEDPEVGIDGNLLRTHLEECASCGTKFAEVLFLMREGGRHAAARAHISRKKTGILVTAAAAAIVVFVLRTTSSTPPIVDRRSTDSQSSVADSPESSRPVAVSKRSAPFSIEEEGTLRLGRNHRSIDATTISGVVRPAEIGPRHIPLPRTK